MAQVLHAERASIQERNSLENLRQKINQAKEHLKESKQKVKTIRDTHQRFRFKLQSAKELLDAVDYRTDWEDAVRGDLSKMAETSAQHWIETLDMEVTNLLQRNNRKRTGKEVNAELKRVACKLAGEGSAKHFAKSLLLPHYQRSANQYCKSAENDALNRCNQEITEVQLSVLPTPISPSPGELPSLPEDDFSISGIQEKKSVLGIDTWIDKQHDGDVILAHINHVAKIWKQEIDARKDAWTKGLLNNHFSTYCEKRRRQYHSHLAQLTADFELRAKPEEEAATATEISHNQIANSISQLEICLAKAMVSIK